MCQFAHLIFLRIKWSNISLPYHSVYQFNANCLWWTACMKTSFQAIRCSTDRTPLMRSFTRILWQTEVHCVIMGAKINTYWTIGFYVILGPAQTHSFSGSQWVCGWVGFALKTLLDSAIFACPIRTCGFSIWWSDNLSNGQNLVTNCQSLKK